MQNDVEYDSILIVVYYVTKYTLFIFMHEASIAIKFAELFFEHVECHFGMPKGVVIDRNSCIILEFWHEICKI